MIYIIDNRLTKISAISPIYWFGANLLPILPIFCENFQKKKKKRFEVGVSL